MKCPVYSTNQRAAIEKVVSVFSDYIRKSPYMDLVWSEKIGYLFLTLNPDAEDPGELELLPFSIKNAEMLCELLFTEIFYDTADALGKGRGYDEPGEEECAETRKRLRPYLERLPEHKALAEQFCDSLTGDGEKE